MIISNVLLHLASSVTIQIKLINTLFTSKAIHSDIFITVCACHDSHVESGLYHFVKISLGIR